MNPEEQLHEDMRNATPRCDARTVRLNCGCCEDVYIDCELGEGHNGYHSCTIEEMGQRNGKYVSEKYAIHWETLERREVK